MAVSRTEDTELIANTTTNESVCTFLESTCVILLCLAFCSSIGIYGGAKREI